MKSATVCIVISINSGGQNGGKFIQSNGNDLFLMFMAIRLPIIEQDLIKPLWCDVSGKDFRQNHKYPAFGHWQAQSLLEALQYARRICSRLELTLCFMLEGKNVSPTSKFTRRSRISLASKNEQTVNGPLKLNAVWPNGRQPKTAENRPRI